MLSNNCLWIKKNSWMILQNKVELQMKATLWQSKEMFSNSDIVKQKVRGRKRGMCGSYKKTKRKRFLEDWQCLWRCKSTLVPEVWEVHLYSQCFATPALAGVVCTRKSIFILLLLVYISIEVFSSNLRDPQACLTEENCHTSSLHTRGLLSVCSPLSLLPISVCLSRTLWHGPYMGSFEQGLHSFCYFFKHLPSP